VVSGWNTIFSVIVSVIEIGVLWFIIYKAALLIKRTKSVVLVNGILAFIVIGVIAKVANFEVLSWIFDSVVNYSLIILVILFRDEIRDLLIHVGSIRIVASKKEEKKVYAHDIKELLEALDYLSSTKTGAIIVFERNIPLGNYIDTGVPINSLISKDKVISIFSKSSSLHDGALIIRGRKMVAAACILPIGVLPPEFTEKKIGKKLGTRHRAAYGISRETDAIAIVVSEETGKISLCLDFYFDYDVDLEVIEDVLEKYFEEFGR
jgi:diadenylate cyclase